MAQPAGATRLVHPAGQRLFFALWPEPAAQRALYAQVRAVLPHGAGRLVVPENLHLTLVFLGVVDEDRRHCLEAAAAAAAVRSRRFSLEFDVAGYWPRPRVLWFGCSRPPQALLDLVAALQSGVGGCGFAADRRPYAAHLTVARKLAHDPGAMAIAPVRWSVEEFVLAESQTRSDRAYYRPLQTWMLEGGPFPASTHSKPMQPGAGKP